MNDWMAALGHIAIIVLIAITVVAGPAMATTLAIDRPEPEPADTMAATDGAVGATGHLSSTGFVGQKSDGPGVTAATSEMSNESAAEEIRRANRFLANRKAQAQAQAQSANRDGRLPASAVPMLEHQQANLATARLLLATDETSGAADNVTRAVRLARRGTRLQAAKIDGDFSPSSKLPAIDEPDHESPSAAAFALLAQHDVKPSAEQAAEIRRLDDLSEPTRSELADYLNAYLAYEEVTERAYADANLTKLQALRTENASLAVRRVNGSVKISAPEVGDGATVSTTAGAYGRLQAAEIGIPSILAARNNLLEETLDLQKAYEQPEARGMTGPPETDVPPPTVQVAPVVSIDLTETNNHYQQDYALVVDAGGHDTYDNNAGGSSIDDTTTRAAALVDFDGNDEYNGSNGGGDVGVGFLFDADGNDAYVAGDIGTNGGGSLGVGFLLDAGGNDAYTAGDGGTNGGGDLGVGFLLDTGGNDNYEADIHGTNGGGFFGSGFLVDTGGNDIYTTGGGGANGGGFFGTGFLLDSGGNDVFNATNSVATTNPLESENMGTNGGGALGVGFLLNAGGNDVYTATCCGANGGGFLGVGLLADGEGADFYNDSRVSCKDCSRIPKGFLGAQVDSNDTGVPLQTDRPGVDTAD